jgi:hypothetical protein
VVTCSRSVVHSQQQHFDLLFFTPFCVSAQRRFVSAPRHYEENMTRKVLLRCLTVLDGLLTLHRLRSTTQYRSESQRSRRVCSTDKCMLVVYLMLLIRTRLFALFCILHTHTHARTHARARVCVSVCVYVCVCVCVCHV